MARSRNIKPSIMDNEDLAALPALTRLLFIYMWMLADRDGRLEDRPSRIKKQALGYDDGSADNMLNELAAAGFIDRYEAQGAKVIQILAFNKHQTPHIRESASELPCKEQAQTKVVPSTNLGSAEHSPRSPDSGFLIPDTPCLIPDSKGESAARQPPAKRAAPTKPEPFEIPEWVNPEHWATWHSCPKRRKATNEQKQLAVNKLDAWRLAGQDFAGALENAAMGGYQGLFLPDKPRVNPGGETAYQRSMREKYEQITPSIAAKAPGTRTQNPNQFFDTLPTVKPLEITNV